MEPGNQTGSDIIQRPLPPDSQTPVETLPYPKLRLRAVKKTCFKIREIPVSFLHVCMIVFQTL